MTRGAGSRNAGAGRRKVAKTSPDRPAKLIARLWQGRTRASRAEEYTRYLYDMGVRKIAAIPGNRGVQLLRLVHGNVAEFEVLSYWDSVDAIRRYAGADHEKVRHLPKDPEYMIGKGPMVRHFEVIVNDWPPA
jgi:heme-degrading monooxygenase HmoA